MNSTDSLLDQLEAAVGGSNLSKRADVLRRVTDLFMSGSGRYTSDQIALFDEVMSKLVENIETSVRATFGSRLAVARDAPPGILRRLAFDDEIDVAAPVLELSEGLDDQVLTENALTMSQSHLLAISKRQTLSEPVTDILVDRGDPCVAASTVRNAGSRFSTTGFEKLAGRCERDIDLAMCVWSRPDVPREHLVRIFRRASDDLRSKLTSLRPREAHAIKAMVAVAVDRVQAQTRAGSAGFRKAEEDVRLLHQAGVLSEERLQQFAGQGDFERTVAAVSLLCALPIGVVEQALVHDRHEQILVFAKSAEFSWTTAKLLMMFKSDGAVSPADLEQYFVSFTRMQVKTARTAMDFYRLRERGRGNA